MRSTGRKKQLDSGGSVAGWKPVTGSTAVLQSDDRSDGQRRRHEESVFRIYEVGNPIAFYRGPRIYCSEVLLGTDECLRE